MVLWLLVEQFMPLEELVSKRLNTVLTTYIQLLRIPAVEAIHPHVLLWHIADVRIHLSYHYWHI
jgi:hypothetical protein